MSDETLEFEHAATFTPAELSGALGLGPLEAQYQELFADALEDGVITPEERAQLERAADNLGLDPQRLLRLEQAMIAAYETHHRVRIVEQYEEPQSLVIPVSEVAGTDQMAWLQRVRELEARVRELEEELRRAQASINVEVDLSDMEAAADAAAEEPDDCWRRARRDPLNPAPYRDLYRIYEARAARDAQWCVAQVLDSLGAASEAQQAFKAQHRTSMLISPRGGVSPSAWYDLLFHPEEEVVTGQILGVIAPAVLIGRVTVLRRDAKLYEPDPASKQDPSRATVTAVRALPWAAKVLGLAAPPIYIDKEKDAAYLHVPGVPPVSVVGRQVLSGRTQLEHAFLAGRHLCWYRQEHFVKTLFSAVPDLEDLFLAALTIGNPALPIAEDVKRRVAPIARAIEPLLDATQVDALRGHYLRFVEEGGRTNLMRWSAAVDKTACRAGLLLCNDLDTALTVLDKEGGKQGELGKDLLIFCASERYFQLRKQLGISLDSN